MIKIDEIVLYFIKGVGGIDQQLKALTFLMCVDIFVNMITNFEHNNFITLCRKKLYVYIMISVGVALDKIIPHEPLKTRNIIILGYAYNEITSIVNIINKDRSFFIPKKVNGYIQKFFSDKDKGEKNDV